MADFTQLDVRGRKLTLVPASAVQHWSDERARAELQAAMDDPRDRLGLEQLATSMGFTHESSAQIVEFLARSLDAGTVVVIRLPELDYGEFIGPRGCDDPGRGDDPLGPRPRDEHHFIEIILLDEHGAPLPDESYALELPDGTVVRGRLDFDGVVRREHIASGDCWIEFDREGQTAPRKGGDEEPLPEPRAYELAPDVDEPVDLDEPAPPELKPQQREPEVDDDDLEVET